MTLTLRSVLILVAVILFVVVALGVDTGTINLLALGLAFFAGAFIVPDRSLAGSPRI